MMKTRRMLLSSLAATAVGLTLPAAAQDFPSRNLKFVVPFAAGSATDTLARILGENLSKSLGRPVVVENLPGASGILAAQNVARADADGHTLLITTNTTHGANQSLLKTVPYDAIKDFEPVGKLVEFPFARKRRPTAPVGRRRFHRGKLHVPHHRCDPQIEPKRIRLARELARRKRGFERPVGLEQRPRRHRPHALGARNLVRRIATQRDEIGYLLGQHLVALDHSGRIDPRNLAGLHRLEDRDCV